MSEPFDPPGIGPFISSNKALLDMAWVTRALKGASWGSWYTDDIIRRAVAGSMCFGLFMRHQPYPAGAVVPDAQIGFARVISDFATKSTLCDVIIEEPYRGQGYGKFLVNTIVNHPELAKTVFELRTKDAHKLYAMYGFEVVEAMRKIPE